MKTPNVKKMNFLISISRSGQDTINIELTEKKSRLCVLDISMTAENFGRCVTGLGHQDASGDYYLNSNIGLYRETKTEYIEISDKLSSDWKSRALEAVSPYEIDGWKAESETYERNVYKNSTGKYAVSFFRFHLNDAPENDATENNTTEETERTCHIAK